MYANSLQQSIAEARNRSSVVAHGAKSVAATSGAGMSSQFMAAGLGAGGSTGANPGKGTPSLAGHAEQLRHYKGPVYNYLRPIVQAAASQPVRIARRRKQSIRKKPRKEVITWTDKERRVECLKDVETGSERIRPHKDALPECLKEYHADLDLIDQHPLLDMVEWPNPCMSGWALRAVSVASMKLTGKCHWWVKLADDGSDRLEAYYIPSNWILPVHEEGQVRRQWKLQPPGVQDPVFLPHEQVFYAFDPDPADPLGAHAALTAMARPVICNEAVQEAQRKGFSNGLFPRHGIVVGRHPDIAGRPGERPMLTSTQRMQIMTAMKSMYRGLTNFDEPVVLDALIENIIDLTRSNREMDFMGSGTWTEKQIGKGTGTSDYLIGGTEPGSMKTSAVAREHFNALTLNPILENFSQCLTMWGRPIFSDMGEDTIIYVEPARATDAEFQLTKQKHLSGLGALQVNEARQELGYPPLPDAHGNKCWMPANLVPVDITSNEEPKPLAPTPAPGQGKAPVPPAKEPPAKEAA